MEFREIKPRSAPLLLSVMSVILPSIAPLLLLLETDTEAGIEVHWRIVVGGAVSRT